MFLQKFPLINLYIKEIYEKSSVLLSLNRIYNNDGSIVCFVLDIQWEHTWKIVIETM